MTAGNEVRPGLFLVRGGTSLPPSLAAESDRPFPEWNERRELTEDQMRRQLEAAGWVLYSYTGTITTRGLGTNVEEATDKAMERLKMIVASRDCNCIEVVEVQVRGIKGFRHVTLSAHSRHIQKGIRKR